MPLYLIHLRSWNTKGLKQNDVYGILQVTHMLTGVGVFSLTPICGKKFQTSTKRNKIYCSNECRNLAYRERNGEQSHFWQGGKTKESDLLRTSAEYKEWRLAVFTRDNFTCQKCGQRKRDIEAHHIKERCKYPELMFDVDNGLTLCHECHKETDNYGWKARWNND